jgi:hypothetical protein
MRTLLILLASCALAWAQKGAGLAIPIDTTIVVKNISKTVTGDTKVAAHPDSCLWAAKMVRWQEPARVVRPQEDVILKSYIGTKDTVKVLIFIGKDTAYYRVYKPQNPPIDSANALMLRLFTQFQDRTVRGRDSTGALK